MPPESPTTARSNPARRISVQMNRVRISVTNSGLMRRSAAIEGSFIAMPLDALQFFDSHQKTLIAGQGGNHPLAAQFGRIDHCNGQRFVQHGRLCYDPAVGSYGHAAAPKTQTVLK